MYSSTTCLGGNMFSNSPSTYGRFGQMTTYISCMKDTSGTRFSPI